MAGRNESLYYYESCSSGTGVDDVYRRESVLIDKISDWDV